MEFVLAVIVLGLLLILVFLLAAMGIRIVSPYEKGVIERLGRYLRTAQPGLQFIIPFIDTMRKVDMREQVVDVQPQEVITKDNVVVTVDAIVYYEATDPVKLTYNVADFYNAATKLAQTNLRNVVGETELDEALTSREMINAKLRSVLDDATDKWGVRVVRVEIKRIDPPADVTAAMHRQMKAERDKRAQILDAEGTRAARILEAEGEAEAVRRIADAQRYKLEAEASGQANAITTVFGSIRNADPDQRVIAIQYLDALKAVANGRASKLFVPYEATAILGALGSIQEVFVNQPKADEDAPATPATGATPPSSMPPAR
ncbi:MAG TPA: SPFH/Band 7/PHB domain protein [Chloroflexi bacterium]|nr:SPFH/Band 7/PHB domain protein [Chloroflexota bacterium]HHW86953.1 SPFH/Band 7/PHB domain protein [Chloroflexota bacterium]